MDLFHRFVIWVQKLKIGHDQPASVVQRANNATQRISHHPVDSIVCFVTMYPLDGDSVWRIEHIICPLQTAERVKRIREASPYNGLYGEAPPEGYERHMKGLGNQSFSLKLNCFDMQKGMGFGPRAWADAPPIEM